MDAADRSGLAAPVSALTSARLKREHLAPIGPFVPPASEAERQLKEVWEAVLDIDGLGVEDDFFELGGESLAAVTLFSELERVLGQMPPLSTLLDYPTIRRLAGRLEQLGAILPDRLLLPVRAQGRRLPLFHAHAAHGNVLFVRRLLPFLDAEQPLFAIQARGLQAGEIPHQSFAAMAADYAAQIRRIQPTGPYMLAGHCVGGLIAFEMARHLKAEGHEVGVVMMIDPDYHPNAVPWLYWRNPSAPQIRIWRALIRPVWFAGYWIRRTLDRLAGRALVQPRTETGANRDRQQAILAGLRTALKAYRPAPYDGKLVIICSAERRRYLTNPTTGWPAIAPRVEFLEISASHDEFFLGALPEVGEAMERILAGVQPADARPLERTAAE
jgi:thioesterase domain-containing protein/acyl carrier protein